MRPYRLLAFREEAGFGGGWGLQLDLENEDGTVGKWVGMTWCFNLKEYDNDENPRITLERMDKEGNA